tara:strand:+ start:112 stop:399 length:288 start_codon:yes stop_codon:yes gene_type:complete
MGLNSHYTYLIISKKKQIYKTYVGYTTNIKKRINAHNNNKGAKNTKGRKWKLIYKKKFSDKKKALKFEYYFKKNRKLRNYIKKKFITNYEKKINS